MAERSVPPTRPGAAKPETKNQHAPMDCVDAMARDKAIENDYPEADEIESIRNALLIGLTAYGELERLIDEYAWFSQNPWEACQLPVDLKPIHPTGQCAGVGIGIFADALRTLEFIPVVRR